MKLSEEEAQAIVYHDGQYIEENKIIAHREEPLTLLLSYADNWAGCALETKVFSSQIPSRKGEWKMTQSKSKAIFFVC
jgi:hypothetical protein